jgi:hypothetical protein
MCANPSNNSCWVHKADQDTVDTVFSCMWEFTYSMRTFINLIEAAYTVAEERAIYLRLSNEGLLDNW